MKRGQKLLFLLTSFFFLTAGSWVQPLNANEEDYYYKLKKSWQYMQNVFEKINMHYVEEIDPYPLVKAGIDTISVNPDSVLPVIEKVAETEKKG